MLTDPKYFPGATAPADHSWAVTPSNSVDLDRVTRSVSVASAGVVMWHNVEGELQQTTFHFDGERVPIKARRIMVTGTTATGIEALA